MLGSEFYLQKYPAKEIMRGSCQCKFTLIFKRISCISKVCHVYPRQLNRAEISSVRPETENCSNNSKEKAPAW